MDEEFDQGLDGLSPKQRNVLLAGSVVLIDSLFEDISAMNDPDWDFADSYMSGFLPRRYLPRYTQLFARQFFICVATAAWKLAQPHLPFPSCLAEALALRAIIDEAMAVAELREEDVDLEGVDDLLFEDLDFELLFDNSRDGLDESIIGQIFGMESLSFKDWFTQYAPEGRGVIHPYVQPEPSSFTQRG